LLPEVNASLEPDVLVSKSGMNIYAEFEIRAHEKLGKWRKACQFQGFVALCSFTPKSCSSLVAECKTSHVSGVATNLQSLVVAGYGPNPNPFWNESWGSGSFLPVMRQACC